MTLPKSKATSYDERFLELQTQENVKVFRVYNLSNPFVASPKDNDPLNMRFFGTDGLEVLVDTEVPLESIGFNKQENLNKESTHIKLYNNAKNIVVDYFIVEDQSKEVNSN